MKNVEKIVFLSGNGNHQLGSEILKELSELLGENCEFDHINYNDWPDGEPDDRIVKYEKIKGKTVVFYQSIYSQELQTEAFDLIWAIKHQYGAKYVIAIFPFFWNRRQDPISNENEKEGPWSKKILKPDEIKRLERSIHLFSVCGVNEMMVATPHSNAMSKLCKKYNIVFHEINPASLFATKINTFVRLEDRNKLRTYAPDIGSMERAIEMGRIFNCPVLFNQKNRAINSEISIVQKEENEIKELILELKKFYKFEDIHHMTHELVQDNIMIMVEDEIASGTTANDTGRLLQGTKAKSIILVATHTVLTPGWRNKLFNKNPFEKIIVTNTIYRGYEKRTGGLIIDISVASLFADSLFQILKSLENK